MVSWIFYWYLVEITESEREKKHTQKKNILEYDFLLNFPIQMIEKTWVHFIHVNQWDQCDGEHLNRWQSGFAVDSHYRRNFQWFDFIFRTHMKSSYDESQSTTKKCLLKFYLNLRWFCYMQNEQSIKRSLMQYTDKRKTLNSAKKNSSQRCIKTFVFRKGVNIFFWFA